MKITTTMLKILDELGLQNPINTSDNSMMIILIECQEINDYIDYVKKNPDKINKERKLLIKNIVMPTLARMMFFLMKKHIKIV